MQRILLIDDDERLSAPLAEYLLRFDLHLDSAVRPGLGLARLRQGGYDAVILDPPAFIKRRKELPQGQAAYRKLNQLAMRVLELEHVLHAERFKERQAGIVHQQRFRMHVGHVEEHALLRLEGLATASESLLENFEALSAQYERSMQMLMG